MTRNELLTALQTIVQNPTNEAGDHIYADNLLLAYVNDPEIAAAFDAIKKWYA